MDLRDEIETHENPKETQNDMISEIFMLFL